MTFNQGLHMETGNMFKVKYTPYNFYSFVENKWIINDEQSRKNQLRENDVVTMIDELTDEMTSTFAESRLLIINNKPTATLAEMEMVYGNPVNMSWSLAVQSAREDFWKEYRKSNEQTRMIMVKNNFHVYFFNNQKTIIWKELLEKITP